MLIGRGLSTKPHLRDARLPKIGETSRGTPNFGEPDTPGMRLVRPLRGGHDGNPSSQEASPATPVPRLWPGSARATMAGR